MPAEGRDTALELMERFAIAGSLEQSPECSLPNSYLCIRSETDRADLPNPFSLSRSYAAWRSPNPLMLFDMRSMRFN
jgi:hypothetical protein